MENFELLLAPTLLIIGGAIATRLMATFAQNIADLMWRAIVFIVGRALSVVLWLLFGWWWNRWVRPFFW
jgi:hypothetical protein